MIENVASHRFSSQQQTELQKLIRGDQVNEVMKQPLDSPSEQQKPINPKEIENIVNGINEFLQPSHTSLKFEFHDELKEYYVAVVDDQTKEVVKEIPPKKLLDFYAAMTEFVGLMIDKKI
ncbi:flagellar protein FlaG [Cytobacillus sp. FJAT-53684]|uniref:Flagellar protein FlaG n=1 Tax=Cytobacillus mangrovibacter TaxID=3299024 RepID=A0ABW6JZK7_9BACI